MVVTDTLVIFDNLRQTLKVVATPYVARPGARRGAPTTARARASTRSSPRCARRAAPLPPLEPPRPASARPTPPPSSFTRARVPAPRSSASRSTSSPATRSRSCCRSGSPSRAAGARPLDVYRALRVINPSPYMFHLEFPEARVTGASPEMLVRLADGRVEVRPIAGTRPRGATAAEDDRARRRAARRSEGARRAPDADRPRPQRRRPRRARSAAVQRRRAHGDRALLARHAPDVARRRRARRRARRWLDVLRAAFPAGTLSGAPKIRAMEIIDELEPHAARHLRRRGRLRQLHRQPRPRDRDPHAGHARRHDLRAGRRRASSPTRCPSSSTRSA